MIPLLPDETPHVKRAVRRHCTADVLVSHGDREGHQAVVVYHLLRRHARIRRKRHAGREWTGVPHLRQGMTPIGTEGGEHEQASHKKQGFPVSPRCDFHPEFFLLGKGAAD